MFDYEKTLETMALGIQQKSRVENTPPGEICHPLSFDTCKKLASGALAAMQDNVMPDAHEWETEYERRVLDADGNPSTKYKVKRIIDNRAQLYTDLKNLGR